MIVVRIEIWPFGSKELARTIGVCKIVNDGTGNPEFGNYDTVLLHSDKYAYRKGVWKLGRVEHHRRTLSPYHLVYKALKACLWPKRNGKKFRRYKNENGGKMGNENEKSRS